MTFEKLCEIVEDLALKLEDADNDTSDIRDALLMSADKRKSVPKLYPFTELATGREQTAVKLQTSKEAFN